MPRLRWSKIGGTTPSTTQQRLFGVARDVLHDGPAGNSVLDDIADLAAITARSTTDRRATTG